MNIHNLKDRQLINYALLALNVEHEVELGAKIGLGSTKMYAIRNGEPLDTRTEYAIKYLLLRALTVTDRQ